MARQFVYTICDKVIYILRARQIHAALGYAEARASQKLGDFLLVLGVAQQQERGVLVGRREGIDDLLAVQKFGAGGDVRAVAIQIDARLEGFAHQLAFQLGRKAQLAYAAEPQRQFAHHLLRLIRIKHKQRASACALGRADARHCPLHARHALHRAINNRIGAVLGQRAEIALKHGGNGQTMLRRARLGAVAQGKAERQSFLADAILCDGGILVLQAEAHAAKNLPHARSGGLGQGQQTRVLHADFNAHALEGGAVQLQQGDQLPLGLAKAHPGGEKGKALAEGERFAAFERSQKLGNGADDV